MEAAPDVLHTLAERFDASAFDAPSGRATLRLRVTGEGDWDATIDGDAIELAAANGKRPDARLAADAATWRRIAGDVRGGMEAFSRGKLKIRDDLHVGVGFLAATSGMTGPERLVLGRIGTEHGEIAPDAGRPGRPRAAAARPRRHEGVLPPDRRRARRLPSA